ncbi:hypothetical protein CVT25_007509 [Psilocybe cyanescens]|uniref:Uncharacterized protein n=1 Tax=Psilocybe cyanescens TaxID=93625 RepID=A0A409WVX4_PSICY|nr:hypothetical protein CVT25_007509 [Psilocybe cyanescens]
MKNAATNLDKAHNDNDKTQYNTRDKPQYPLSTTTSPQLNGPGNTIHPHHPLQTELQVPTMLSDLHQEGIQQKEHQSDDNKRKKNKLNNPPDKT